MATEDLRNGVEAFFGGGKPEFQRPLNRAAADAVSGVRVYTESPVPAGKDSP